MRVMENKNLLIEKTVIETFPKIGGFEAIPKLVEMMEKNSHHLAALTLYKFGDRRGLQYFLSRKISSPLQSYVKFTEFDDLIVFPLLQMLKALEQPEQSKEGFFHLFDLFRSKKFAHNVMEYLERDVALAQKLIPLIQVLYPAQSKFLSKALQEDGGNLPDSRQLHNLILLALGESPHKIVARLKHKNLVHNSCLTTDGRYFVTADFRGEVTIWKTDTWQQETAFTLKRRKYYHTHPIAVTPDGKYLLTANNVEKTIDVWEFGNWEQSMMTLHHTEGICSVAAASDSKSILAGGIDTVKIWEFGAWKEVAELAGHSNGIEVLKTVPGKHCVITGDRNGVIQIWDEGNWEKIADLKVNGIIADSVAASPDGRFVIAVETLAIYLETKVKVWETETWQETGYFTIYSSTPVTCLGFTPDEKYVIAACSKKIIFLKVGSWKEFVTLGNNADPRAITVTPDGKYMIAGTDVWKVDLSVFNP